MARAVLHNAPLLLLDEPTSAMDFSSEAQVTQRMKEFTEGKTVVLVTHRTSMLSFVDRIIVIEDGVVVEQGKHEALITQGGLYARLAKLQFA